MQKWQCTVCGYIHVGSEPPEKCPVCGADRSLFVALEPKEASSAGPAETNAIPSEAGNQTESRQWRCAVCGYIHTGANAPVACPVCGADQDQYAALPPSSLDSAEKVRPAQRPAETTAVHPAAAQTPAAADENAGRLAWILDKMVDLHAHPIAVHIPNGVLPIAVIFLLLGTAFHSRTLSTAAFYNLIFIALAMPIVLFSGYNDWQRRFSGRLTHVFLTKMICGGIVLIGTFSAVIWRLFDPGVTLPGASARWSYLVLHLVVLAAAIVAGFYGGKLIIFPNRQR